MISLADLPLEVTSRIADNLETPDTNALALTCRALQVAAEPYIWEAILLDPFDREGSKDSDGDAHGRHHALNRGENSLSGTSRAPPPSATKTDIERRYSEVFAAGPYVRRLVERIRLTVEEIELEGRHTQYGILQCGDNAAHIGLYNALAGIKPLGRLTRLSASFTYHWERQIGLLSRLGPDIAELDLVAQSAIWESPGTFSSSDTNPSELGEPENSLNESDGRPWIVLPKLTSLSLRHLHPSCRVFVPALLEWADKITKLEVRAYRPLPLQNEEDDPVIKALQGHETIEHLVWCTETWQSYAALPRLFNGTGWEKLQVLETGGGVEMESETYIENIHIPEASHMERLIIPCRTEAWYKHVRPPDWGKAPPPRTGLIVNYLCRQLKLCPKLDTVIFSVYEREPELDPARWCSKRINGVLIRSYTNGEDELIHFRRLELLMVNPDLYADYDADELDECNGKDHRWVDHTNYKGCVVLPDVLDKVYKELGGEGRAWMTPGRALELPDKAWRLLQRGLGRAKRVIA